MEEKELVEQETSPALEGIQELDKETEQPEESPKQEKQPQNQPQVEENMRNLREAKLRAERERDELLRERNEFLQRQQQPAPEPEEDYNIAIHPDDIPEGKHLLKINKRFQKMEREYQERLNNYERQASMLAAESQLRIKYPDIDKVINAETIAMLKEQEPELAASVNANPDIYSKSVAVYKMIKRLGIHKDPETLQAQAQLYQNNQKPRNSSAVSPQKAESPLSQASAYGAGLTKEMKEQARRELAAILRGG
jgi:hypothetical protein